MCVYVVWMYVCMYIRIHKQYVHTHTHTHKHVCMYACMHVCIYACYIYIYIHIHTHTHTYIHIYLFRPEQRGNSRVRRLQERGVAHNEDTHAVFGHMCPQANYTRGTRQTPHSRTFKPGANNKTQINTPAIGVHVVDHALAHAGKEGAKVLCKVLYTGGSSTQYAARARALHSPAGHFKT